MQEVHRYDPELGKLAESLREAGYVLEDVSRTARDYRDGVEFDPEELERGQERMAALQGLMRAYGPRMADVLAAREEAADLVSLVDDAEERERVAQRAVDAAERALAAAARTLDDARGEAAPRFSQAVSAQMQRLEMGTAQLVCEQRALPRASWTRSGASEVEFMFQPGEEVLSGARSMIEAGILEDPHVDAAMGAHMIPMIPAGLGGYGLGGFGVCMIGKGHVVARAGQRQHSRRANAPAAAGQKHVTHHFFFLFSRSIAKKSCKSACASSSSNPDSITG